MAEKKAEQKKPFDAVEKAVNDAWHVGFFGDRTWSPEAFLGICKMRGLSGTDIWNHEKLSAPLRLFVQTTRGVEDVKLNALLHNFAVALNIDENAVRRHFWAIRFQVEEQFLAAVKLAEEKRRKLEALAEEAEKTEISESEEPEEIETEETEEEEEETE
jgi:hypothetical protein